jgi:hypothetical protein
MNMNSRFVKIVLMFFLSLAAQQIFVSNNAFAVDAINENDMFSGRDMITEQVPQNKPTPAAEQKKTIGFSGEITSAMADVISSTGAKNSLYSYSVANIFLDVRLKNDVKAFANLETTYLSQKKLTEVALRELFFDFNYNRRIYFRTGKQVLQWGRCYLWNPTDLINIEKKPFIRKIGYREGTYGMKFHVPFGTKYNIYGFIDTGNASYEEDIGEALKFEFLLGGTEMAFSGWAKNNYNGVFGYDISSRICEVDIAGEASASYGDNTRHIREQAGVLDIYKKTDEWIPRASINFSKSFRVGNFNDRLTVSSEFFYNHTGYEDNIFGDNSIYTYSTPVGLAATGTKKDFLLGNGLYEMNYHSKYYGALFLTLGRFLIEDMTLTANYIRNCNDGSGIISSGVTYKNMNDLSAGILFDSYIGPRDAEYTYSDTKYDVQLTFGISF